MDILTTLSCWYQGQNQTFQPSLCVAYSGGRDSHVLLHALYQLRQQTGGFELQAIHVDHGLLAHSHSWAKHCEKTCQTYQIPFTKVSLKLTIPSGESVENIARIERYRIFEQHLKPQQILLLAHSQDDQAETLLLQLMRGSGPLGLSSMESMRSLGKGKLARPLLNVSRDHIARYAEQNQLDWIEDDSNQNKRFRRNFLRLEIFPRLRQAFPAVTECIARSAKQCANMQSVLDEYVQVDFQLCLGKNPFQLNLAPLRRLSDLKQQHILRYWFRYHGIILPSSKKLQTLWQQMLLAKQDASPSVKVGKVCIRRYKETLYLNVDAQSDIHKKEVWDITQSIQLKDGSVWQGKVAKGEGLALSKLKTNLVSVSYRQGGERCRPLGSKNSRPLKKIFQEYAIAPWERARIPLFYSGSDLVRVGDLFICEGWQVDDASEEGLIVEKINHVG